MRKFLFALTILAIGIVVVWTGNSRNAKGEANSTSTNSAASHKAHITLQQSEPATTIDGSVNPQLIPDTVAYSLLFNLLSDRAKSERRSLQSYCNQTGLAQVSLDGLLRAASYYRKNVAENEAQAEALRKSLPDMSLMDPQVVAQFTALRLQREAMINETIAKLPDFIGTEGAHALRRHIDERVKIRTKIVPGPLMPVTH